MEWYGMVWYWAWDLGLVGWLAGWLALLVGWLLGREGLLLQELPTYLPTLLAGWASRLSHWVSGRQADREGRKDFEGKKPWLDIYWKILLLMGGIFTFSAGYENGPPLLKQEGCCQADSLGNPLRSTEVLR